VAAVYIPNFITDTGSSSINSITQITEKIKENVDSLAMNVGDIQKSQQLLQEKSADIQNQIAAINSRMNEMRFSFWIVGGLLLLLVIAAALLVFFMIKHRVVQNEPGNEEADIRDIMQNTNEMIRQMSEKQESIEYWLKNQPQKELPDDRTKPVHAPSPTSQAYQPSMLSPQLLVFKEINKLLSTAGDGASMYDKLCAAWPQYKFIRLTSVNAIADSEYTFVRSETGPYLAVHDKNVIYVFPNSSSLTELHLPQRVYEGYSKNGRIVKVEKWAVAYAGEDGKSFKLNERGKVLMKP
jgi:hypothetical protein